jgi:hydrogenase expression/formation protein HypC
MLRGSARGTRRDGLLAHFGTRRTLGVNEESHVCLAIPGKIVAITDEVNRLATVDVVGVRRTVNIGLLDAGGAGAGPGDWVLIHVGFALSRIDEEEAAATLRLLRQMGSEYEQELEELKASAIE